MMIRTLEPRRTIDWQAIIEKCEQYPGKWVLARKFTRKSSFETYAKKHNLETKRRYCSTQDGWSLWVRLP